MKKMMKYSLILALCLSLLFCAVCKAEASENSQSLSLTGVGNARELGGYTAEDGKTVKRGVLLRTAKLVNATEEDIARLLSVYHLAVDVDFRGDNEVERAPDPVMEGVEYLNIHILDDSMGPSEELEAEIAALEAQGVEIDKITEIRLFMKYGGFTDQMYVDFLSSDVGKAGYSRFFQALLALPEDGAILFHCSQGKDRTGCGAMLILFALGVDEETVMADFMLTNEYNAALIAEERQYLIENGVGEDELETFMKSMDQVFPAFMENAIQWMTEAYGSPLGYITGALGVTDEDIQLLRDHFLE
ncbi:MAG: tyrosine-protein phosphatase [Clostridia bacterium]|nr:tyrosine-protein phosphatase [Clostridia bacterium]